MVDAHPSRSEPLQVRAQTTVTRRRGLARFARKAVACWAVLTLLGVTSRAAEVERLKAVSPARLQQAIERGVAFLVENQNQDGSWGSPRRTKDMNILAPVPGAHQAFRSAVTALAIEALMETSAVTTNPGAPRVLARGEVWLLEHLPQLRRADGMVMYNVWSHAYGIQALAHMYRREAPDSPRRLQIQTLLKQQYDLLRRYESVDGGWGYYDFRVQAQRPASDSLSFVTATVLVALQRARAIGLPPPEDLVARGLASIRRQQKHDHSYLYGEYLKWMPMMPVNRPAASLGRSQACHLALRWWGDKAVTDDVMVQWLDRLVTRNEWLSFGRKRPIPHESWFQVAGYFFYYGHYYAALCAEELGREKGRPYREHLAALLVPLQEKDGSWWDFPLYDYHQPYGTAFTLMALARCRAPD
jgi:hypothetical protein